LRQLHHVHGQRRVPQKRHFSAACVSRGSVDISLPRSGHDLRAFECKVVEKVNPPFWKPPRLLTFAKQRAGSNTTPKRE
jgi:hypothetical protein